MSQVESIFDAFLSDDEKNVAYLLDALTGHEALLSSLPNLGLVVSDFSNNVKKIRDSHDSFVAANTQALGIHTLEKLEQEKHPGGTPDNSACVGIRWAAISMEFTVELISAIVEEAAAKLSSANTTSGQNAKNADAQGVAKEDARTLTKADLVNALEAQGKSAKQFVHEVYPRTLKRYHTTLLMKMAFKGGLAFWSGSAADFLRQLPFSDLKEVRNYVDKVRKTIVIMRG